jgi:hypothetical protein
MNRRTLLKTALLAIPGVGILSKLCLGKKSVIGKYIYCPYVPILRNPRIFPE